MNEQTMMRFSLPLMMLLVAGSTSAGEPLVIDLGDGARVEIDGGKVKVFSESSGGGSVSSSSSSRTEADGSTVTEVTMVRDGKTVKRTIRVGADGKVSIDGGGGEGVPGKGEADGDQPAQGWLGVHGVPVPEALRDQLDLPEGEGVLLEVVTEGGPGAGAGLGVNDVLLRWNGVAMAGVEGFRRSLASVQPGAVVTLEGLRKGKPMQWEVTVGSRPAGKVARRDPSRPGGKSSGFSSSSSSSSSGGMRRTVVVGPDGKVKVTEGGEGADAFESMLSDPKVPEEMKEQLRKAREQMRKVPPREDTPHP
jgi:hypothetical protein